MKNRNFWLHARSLPVSGSGNLGDFVRAAERKTFTPYLAHDTGFFRVAMDIFPLYCVMNVRKIAARTRAKTSINELLRSET